MDSLEDHRIDHSTLKIIRCITSGSDGSVFEIEWNTQRLAMKQIHNSRADKYNAGKIAMMLKLKHSNVIQLQKYSVEPYCLIMELCKCNLHQIIHSVDLITALHFQRYTTQLADGMQYLHSQNVVHRDLKSENVLVSHDSNIKICDFDRSKSISLEAIFMSTQTGTLWWMAPEMLALNKGEKFTPAVDLWSFAVILWEMITQRLPYNSLLKNIQNLPQLQQFSTSLTNSAIRLSFPVGTPQILRILLSECLLAQANRRPSFDTVASCVAKLEINEYQWTALKTLWRVIPFDYTYSKEEEDDFITRREYFTSTGKRWEELIENITKTGEDLENTNWNLETIKDIINKREGLDWEWDISYWEEFALEEPNAQNLRRILNDNKFLKCNYDDYINKIKSKVLCDDVIEFAKYVLGNGNAELRIRASNVLFHVIQEDKERSSKEMVELIISSVKVEEDVELVMNCSILLTLPIMRPVLKGKQRLFLLNALRVHLNNVKMTNLFSFIFDGLSDFLKEQLCVQMVETGLVESIMKSLVSSENIENVLIRNWWRILFTSTLFNRQSSLIFIENKGIQCFHEHTKRYWNDSWILRYIFHVINLVVIDSSSRSQFLTKEFVEEHFQFIRLNSEHTRMCHFAVHTCAILLDESTWEMVKMSKSSFSKTLVKIIMAWSLTTRWKRNWKPVLSLDNNEVMQSYTIFYFLKAWQSISSEDRSELLKILEALTKDSKKSDELRTYAEVAWKLLEARNGK